MMYGLSDGLPNFVPWMFGLGFLGLGFVVILAIASIVLKGYALWHAARRSEKGWFIALLIINTLGILELIYLFFIVGKWHKFTNDSVPPSSPSPTPQA